MHPDTMATWIRGFLTRNAARLNDEQRQNFQLTADMLVMLNNEVNRLKGESNESKTG